MANDPAQRAEETRTALLTAFERMCPFVAGNPFIPHWPLPRQAVFLGSHRFPGAKTDQVFEALYGGAAGGGKSDALLMAVAQFAWKFPDFAAICFRRTFVDLTLPGALLDRAREWWIPRGVQWLDKTSTFHFPSGAKATFAHLSQKDDHLKYQGAEFQLSCWDELTQWPTERPYEYVGRSRIRRKSGSQVPLRTLSASNPGGPGHSWVQRRFVGTTDTLTGEHVPADHVYVPARLIDNPHLDRDSYMRGLEGLDPTTRQQLLDGDWSARDPGDYFRAEWFGPLLDPEAHTWDSANSIRIRWWDLAASENPDNARTAGVKMARHRSGVRAIEHAVAFRKTPGSRDDAIIQQAQVDGFGTIVGLEVEPGSGGIAQFDSLKRRLTEKGFRVVGARPKTEQSKLEGVYVQRAGRSDIAKASRAEPVSACLERGYVKRGEGGDPNSDWFGVESGMAVIDQTDGIRLFAGPWVQEYLDEIEGFPDVHRMDYVDATSGAWAWLEAHPFGRSMPVDQGERADPGQLVNRHDLHPEDREELEQAGRPRFLRP